LTAERVRTNKLRRRPRDERATPLGLFGIEVFLGRVLFLDRDTAGTRSRRGEQVGQVADARGVLDQPRADHERDDLRQGGIVVLLRRAEHGRVRWLETTARDG